jgi:hypothetical protein
MVGIATPFLDFTGANETQDPAGNNRTRPVGGPEKPDRQRYSLADKTLTTSAEWAQGLFDQKKGGALCPAFFVNLFRAF